ncbi:hypothetical protein ABZ649_30735 [Streptomyces albidoflavus]|nr:MULTISPECIES: hypothetical protein [Streptomyces]AMM08028.1 hypothetical protein Salbus254_1493 [Streptomyces albidoflavus]QXQ27453.1 hypothetical protein STALF2_23620 [Streptomyces albidoflavus]QXQ33380.1 hypothetical protein STALF4_23690 [Streptomyces albidoflavus]UNR56352.1 hypothetical protein IPZ55_06915 [Streptomyces sp. A10(2020)]
MLENEITAALVALSLTVFLIFGVLALLRCNRKDIAEVLRVLLRRK